MWGEGEGEEGEGVYCSLVRWGKTLLYFTFAGLASLAWLAGLAGWLGSSEFFTSLYPRGEARLVRQAKERKGKGREGKGKDDNVTRYDLRPAGQRGGGKGGRYDGMALHKTPELACGQRQDGRVSIFFFFFGYLVTLLSLTLPYLLNTHIHTPYHAMPCHDIPFLGARDSKTGARE